MTSGCTSALLDQPLDAGTPVEDLGDEDHEAAVFAASYEGFAFMADTPPAANTGLPASCNVQVDFQLGGEECARPRCTVSCVFQ